MPKTLKSFIVALCIALSASWAFGADVNNAGEKKADGGKPPEGNGPPPALVAASMVSSGMVAPEAEFIGTVYYDEVSDVASEVRGRVEAVYFEEGQRVAKGERLVALDAELLSRDLEGTRAAYGEVLNNLEKARTDLKRSEPLHAGKLVSDKEYDDLRFAVLGLEKRAASLKADVGRKEAELRKKSITAPFNGVVVKRGVARGEWLGEGSTVATVAKDDVLEVVVNVPGGVVPFIAPGMDVIVRAGGREVRGTVYAVIRRGDVPTRTFPVKIKLKNVPGLYEGMEARVVLPVGKKTQALLINRDAIIDMFGRTVVYAVVEGKAAMMPVEVVGYVGVTAGIKGEGLAEGMALVVKGNERLRPGQPVMVQGGGGK